MRLFTVIICFIFFLLFSSFIVSAEFISWSNPKKLAGEEYDAGVLLDFPVVKALPDGNLVVAGYLFTDVVLRIYSNEHGPILQTAVDPNINALLSEGPWTRLEWLPSYRFQTSARLAVGNDGRIAIFYNGFPRASPYRPNALSFKVYESDGRTVVVDSVVVRSQAINQRDDIGDIAITPNGEIHVLYSHPFPEPTSTTIGVYYRRYSPAGQPLGSEVVLWEDTFLIDPVAQMVLVAAPDNSVDALLVHPDPRYPYSISRTLFRRRIIDGTPSPLQPLSGIPELTDNHQAGVSAAIDRYGNDYVAWWRELEPWERLYGQSRPSKSTLLLRKVDPRGTIVGGWQIAPSYGSLRTSETSPMTQLVIDSKNNKYIIWSDPRAQGGVRNLHFSKFDSNDVMVVNQQPLASFMGNEDYMQAAVDPMGKVHIVYLNGFLTRNGADAPQAQAFLVKSQTSMISVDEQTCVGRTARIDISSPDNPNKQYIFALSLGTRTFPLLLPPPGNGYVFPLSLDAVLVLSVTNRESVGLVSGAVGTLGMTGTASINFDIRSWVSPGIILYGAFIVYDPARSPPILDVSSAKRILIKEGGMCP